MTKCRQPDCLRAPAYPDQAYCERHRLIWTPATPKFVPAWKRNLQAKDTTDYGKAA